MMGHVQAHSLGLSNDESYYKTKPSCLVRHSTSRVRRPLDGRVPRFHRGSFRDQRNHFSLPSKRPRSLAEYFLRGSVGVSRDRYPRALTTNQSSISPLTLGVSAATRYLATNGNDRSPDRQTAQETDALPEGSERDARARFHGNKASESRTNRSSRRPTRLQIRNDKNVVRQSPL